METMYFVLGMLSIIAAAIVSVMVWGIVKINKQQQWIDSIQRQIEYAARDNNDRVTDLYRNTDMQIGNVYKAINDQITDAVTQCNSYTDSRIDKATSGLNGAKQVIKG